VNEPFLYRIVDTVVHENECQYGDLREKQTYITKVIRTEEESFARTIDGGMRIFAEMLAEHQAKGETVFSGADAFKLYDTFGFPIDLTACGRGADGGRGCLPPTDAGAEGAGPGGSEGFGRSGLGRCGIR